AAARHVPTIAWRPFSTLDITWAGVHDRFPCRPGTQPPVQGRSLFFPHEEPVMLETLRPDPTFYPSARMAMEAEPEKIAYTALLSPDRSRPDALAVVDVDPQSASYGTVLHRLDMPN